MLASAKDWLRWRLRAARYRARRAASALAAGPALAPGIDLAGYYRGSLGLGDSVRLLAKALQGSGIPCGFHALPLDRDTQDPQVPLTAGFPHSVAVVHANPPHLPALLRRYGSGFLGRRKLVGLWYWELEVVPDAWRAMAGLFDELWVASEWSRAHFAAQVDCPVHAFPFPADAIDPDPGGREAPFDLPEDRYIFLNLFDYHSSFDRKNPLAAVRAYLQAFPEDRGGAHMVVKSLNADRAPEAHARLLAMAAGRADLQVVDADLPRPAMDTLYARAHCFVSLHRSEGLGLGFLQALRNGREALVTGYSAPAEFEGLPGLHLVPYRRVPVDTEFSHYRGLGCWADPDEDAAAQAMRTLAGAGAGRRREEGAPGPASRRFTCAAFNAFVAGRLAALDPRAAGLSSGDPAPGRP